MGGGQYKEEALKTSIGSLTPPTPDMGIYNPYASSKSTWFCGGRARPQMNAGEMTDEWMDKRETNKTSVTARVAWIDGRTDERMGSVGTNHERAGNNRQR